MATKKRKARSRKKVVRKKKVRRAVKRHTVKRSGKRTSKVANAKRIIRSDAEQRLKDALYERDCATTRKQHNKAQRKVTAARRDKNKFN